LHLNSNLLMENSKTAKRTNVRQIYEPPKQHPVLKSI